MTVATATTPITESSPVLVPSGHPPTGREDLAILHAHIHDSTAIPPFHKRVYKLLGQIPRGHVTTYAAVAAHLHSSARAVGNALRRNPLAPAVPCHRVVATGGALGGFKGKWPRCGEGITIDEKRLLLRREGVRFDVKGRVVGTPFTAFYD